MGKNCVNSTIMFQNELLIQFIHELFKVPLYNWNVGIFKIITGIISLRHCHFKIITLFIRNIEIFK